MSIPGPWLRCGHARRAAVGAVVCLPFGSGLVAEIDSSVPVSLAWLVYLGLLPTALAFTTWAFALGRTTAGRLGSTSYLVPAVAIVLAWLLQGEAPRRWPSPVAPWRSAGW